MRIQFTDRDMRIVEELYAGARLLSPNAPLTKILGVAVAYQRPYPGVVSIVSARCHGCEDDTYAVNPTRDAVDSVGWCGCKPVEIELVEAEATT